MTDAIDTAPNKTPGQRALDRSHPHQADTITPPNLVHKGPGKLTGGGQLFLHTRLGHQLFFGRRSSKEDGAKHAIVGLTRFHANIRNIWQASADNDPYADAVLLELEDAHSDATEYIADRQAELDGLINSNEQIELMIYQTESPVQIPLNFSTPWGYVAAALLVRFDVLTRTALSARHYGLLPSDDYYRCIRESGRKLRHMFALSSRWVNTGVRREDIAEGNQIAERAYTKYCSSKALIQSVPDEVMLGDLRPQQAPPVRDKGVEQPALSAAAYIVDDEDDLLDE